MAAECATTAITRMARLLEVSTSGYYKRANRSGTTELTDREQRKANLTVKIIDHHRDSGGVYGSPRITADLRAAGERVSEKTVATIMSEIGLAGISLRPRDPGTPQGRWCRRTLMPAGVDRWVQPGSVGTTAARNRCGRRSNTNTTTVTSSRRSRNSLQQLINGCTSTTIRGVIR